MWKRVWSGGLLNQAVGWRRLKSPERPSMSLLLVLGFRRPFVSPYSLVSPCYVSNSNSNYNDFDSRAELLNQLFNNNRSVSFSSSSSSATTSSDDDSKPTSKSTLDKDTITFTEAKKLMRLVNVEALKMKLGMEGKEVIGYAELLKACESMGVARSIDEAVTFARVLDEAGVVLLFRDKVYLHPDKVSYFYCMICLSFSVDGSRLLRFSLLFSSQMRIVIGSISLMVLVVMRCYCLRIWNV